MVSKKVAEDWLEHFFEQIQPIADQYVLDDRGEPVPEPDLLKWSQWFGSADRSVASTEFGNVRVSTVFLGLDHGFGGPRRLLYETMIFGGEHDEWCSRAATREEAEMIHAEACALVGAIH